MASVEVSMIKARGAEKRGDFAEAEQLYETILQRFPGNARARQSLDRLVAGRSADMLHADAPPQPQLDRLADLYRTGQLAPLVGEAEALLVSWPRSAFVHNLLGAALLGLGQPDKAASALRRALAGGVRHPAICNNLGMALAATGRPDEAAAAYGEAIALNPRYAAARNNLGNALKAIGRTEEAVQSYRAAIAIEPTYVDAICNLGVALEDLARRPEAEAAYRQVLELEPDHAPACNNLGNLLACAGDVAGAAALYERALGIDAAYADAWFNLGNARKRQGRLAEAVSAYEQAHAAQPDRADVWTEQGKALALGGKLDEAIAALGRGLAIAPGDSGAMAHSLFYRAYICDWTAHADFARIAECFDGGVSPFAALPFEDDPERQLRRSRAWVRAAAWPQPAPLPPRLPGDKIRLGYFSADFHDHATMYLLAGLLRAHDRTRFELHAFSFGPDCADAMRGELLDRVDSFTDIAALPDAAVAELARTRGIDIAVDLKGFTQGSRVALFAQRLAPLQIAFLGYPGSMGADCIDYLVADPVVVPGAERAFYAEKLLLLPPSYQANDDRRPIADTGATRASLGLPEDGFVFCCFNHNYKIGPAEFDIWMRLLGKVQGSVLWLLRSNPWAETNLRREAAARGIDPGRLIFAETLPHHEHLGRLRHADLFLDTFAVNAHTTASDALWAGLPVLTRPGRQFAARVGASLLEAVGLPELIAGTATDYEGLALELATTPDSLAEIRSRLAANRDTHPLFDTARYSRAFEAGLSAVWQRHCAGEALADITIE